MSEKKGCGCGGCVVGMIMFIIYATIFWGVKDDKAEPIDDTKITVYEVEQRVSEDENVR